MKLSTLCRMAAERIGTKDQHDTEIRIALYAFMTVCLEAGMEYTKEMADTVIAAGVASSEDTSIMIREMLPPQRTEVYILCLLFAAEYLEDEGK